MATAYGYPETNIPTFTMLDDMFASGPPPLAAQPATWQKMYSTSLIGAPPNNPYSNYAYQDINQHDYVTTVSSEPEISPRLNQMVNHNNQLRSDLKYYGMQDNQPEPLSLQYYGMQNPPSMQLPQPLALPTWKPPYGTSDPSTPYSAYDSELAKDSSTMISYAYPGVPAGAQPALMDGRADPVKMKEYTYYLTSQGFKEGYNKAKEEYKSSACVHASNHVSTCHICKGFLGVSTTIYKIGIIVLLLIVLILAWLLLRKKRGYVQFHSY